MRYQAAGVPTVVFAGEEYGTGSSRDWAAKGTQLLGIKAVVARSFERIHRSNLVGMGVLPLQFKAGDSWESLGLTGDETIEVLPHPELLPQSEATLVITRAGRPAPRGEAGAAHRHAGGSGLLPGRRNPPLRVAAIVERLSAVTATRHDVPSSAHPGAAVDPVAAAPGRANRTGADMRKPALYSPSRRGTPAPSPAAERELETGNAVPPPPLAQQAGARCRQPAPDVGGAGAAGHAAAGQRVAARAAGRCGR